MNEWGIIYVATQHLRYLCEAIASAESAKARCPELQITLFTDSPDFFHSSSKPFDKIIPVEYARPVPDTPQLSWGTGLHQRITSLRRSPYRRTLHLDTDTRVLSGEVLRLFEYLEEYSIALVPCPLGKSRGRRLYGPMFNGGVIAYRYDTHIDQLLRTWEQLQDFHMELASMEPPGDVPYLSHLDHRERRFMLTNDQTSLARLLSPEHNAYNIAVKVLDDVWNARNPPRDQLDGVIIDHSDCYKIMPRQVAIFLETRGLNLPSQTQSSDREQPQLRSRIGGTMTASREPRSLIEQLALELLRDERTISGTERELLHRVLERGLAESTGDEALDAAVSQRLVSAVAASIGARISQVLAYEVLRQMSERRPIGPGMDPFGPGRGPIPGRPVPGLDPGLGPIVGPFLGPRTPGIFDPMAEGNPGNDPDTGPQGNPGNDPDTGPQGNPGNDPASMTNDPSPPTPSPNDPSPDFPSDPGEPGPISPDPGEPSPGRRTSFPRERRGPGTSPRVPGVGTRPRGK